MQRRGVFTKSLANPSKLIQITEMDKETCRSERVTKKSEGLKENKREVRRRNVGHSSLPHCPVFLRIDAAIIRTF